MNSLIFIFIGGGIGSVIRFLISKQVSSNFTNINPLATLTSNFLATLLLAYLMYFIHDKNPMHMGWKLLTITAVCGGFSTFSTFSYETYELFKMNMSLYAILNILISVGLGVFVMFVLSKVA